MPGIFRSSTVFVDELCNFELFREEFLHNSNTKLYNLAPVFEILCTCSNCTIVPLATYIANIIHTFFNNFLDKRIFCIFCIFVYFVYFVDRAS
jgi:hypothetical protein